MMELQQTVLCGSYLMLLRTILKNHLTTPKIFVFNDPPDLMKTIYNQLFEIKSIEGI